MKTLLATRDILAVLGMFCFGVWGALMMYRLLRLTDALIHLVRAKTGPQTIHQYWHRDGGES